MTIRTHEGALVAPAVAAEIEALNQRIDEQEKAIADLQIVVNNLVELGKLTPPKLSHPSSIE